MQYRLLVSDIDGTLVEEDNEFDESLPARIDEFRRNGGLFTIATGRSPALAAPVVERLRIELPVIYMNGALVMEPSTQNTISESFLDSRLAQALVPWLDAHGFNYMAFTDDHDISRIHKLLVIGLESPEQGFRQASPVLSRLARFVTSGDGMWEVIPKGVSKGAAVRRLANTLGLSMDQVVTIGDQMNDLEMTMMAGLGTAVSNANPGLKRVAAQITNGRCWHGVCEVLDEVLLSQQGKSRKVSLISPVCVAG